MAERLRIERGHIMSVDEVAQGIKDGEPEAFAQFRRTYFLIDQFPENDVAKRVFWWPLATTPGVFSSH
jgi:hypothetical protein